MSRTALPLSLVAEQPPQRLPRLPRLSRPTRSGPALHPTPLAGSPDVLGLNITRGCGMRCGFCSVRASPNWPGDDLLLLYRGTADRLRDEVRAASPRPRAVFLCPACDPFPPVLDVQTATADVIDVLADEGVESWVMTRGVVRPAVLDRVAAHREKVRFTLAINTLNRSLQRQLEPGAAPPRLRLRQVGRLRRAGLAVQVEVGPLLPGLTDTPENLKDLLAALADAGVTAVSTSYAFVRTPIEAQMRAEWPEHLSSTALHAYERGPVLASPGLAAARYAPRGRRQRGYATLMALAAARGIGVTVSGLTNPDFAAARPAAPQPHPEQPASEPRPSLLRMFLQAHHHHPAQPA